MASIIYNSALYDAMTSAIDFDTDTFKCMLVNATYAAIADETKKDSHLKRSAVTANEATGTGYTAGGVAATVTVTKDTANNRIDVSLGAVSWASSTITASGAVYYKSRGGADTADELVAYIDFAGAVTSTNGTFSLTASTLRLRAPFSLAPARLSLAQRQVRLDRSRRALSPRQRHLSRRERRPHLPLSQARLFRSA